MTVSTSHEPAGQRPGSHAAPLVCGALGSYDRERLIAIAASLPGAVQPVHEDERSMLMLDRRPHEWRGSGEYGLGWIEGAALRPGARGWRDASRRGACGLAFKGRQAFLHSSISGVGPLYWMQVDGAAYFCSRIDPLVVTSPRRLSTDWDAWASIIVLRYPLGERTPFEEIKRVRPYSTLGLRFGRVRRRSPRWPWTEVEASTDLDTAAEQVADGIERAFGPVKNLEVCPLSGGRDSRMLLAAAVKAGLSPTAVTVSDDEGGRFEEEGAAPVAAALGVDHEVIDASPDEYPRQWAERAHDVEYQFVDHAWLVPLAQRIESVDSAVPDGYALDTLLQAGAHFYTPEILNPKRPRHASQALFERLRRYGHAQLALTEPLQWPLLARTQAQFLREARQFEGHPWQATLTVYASRTVRGISCYPSGLLGSRAQILLPGTSDEVITAALSLAPSREEGHPLHDAVLERLSPAAAELPSTHDMPRSAPYLPRRWCSSYSVEAHRARIESGPLAPFVSPPLRAWLAGETTDELSPDLRLGMEAISLFHAWWERYRGRLRDVDPADLTC